MFGGQSEKAIPNQIFKKNYPAPKNFHNRKKGQGQYLGGISHMMKATKGGQMVYGSKHGGGGDTETQFTI